jgi:hypothetical protein
LNYIKSIIKEVMLKWINQYHSLKLPIQ